jgi:beta-galactosidase
MTPLQSLIPKLPPGFLYGGDYNPEQWPESVWIEDARLMREAGVNFISLGIFAWAKLEPAPGRYDFAWLDRVIDLLWKAGISLCFATATASPPAWFSRLHPEGLAVGRAGDRFTHGSRQHYCPNSKAYRAASLRLIAQLAGRYGHHPAVALWHINNELGCHINACYCEVCAAEFRLWLQRRYGTLDALNEAWGTAFWSHIYSDWSEIQLPNRTPTFGNPTQGLDHQRFVSDSLRAILLAESAAIRAVVPDAKMTTNGVFTMKPADYRDWFQHCDVAALDCYPDPSLGLVEVRAGAFCNDHYRSFKNGLPFILMEQVTSQVNWRATNVLKQPGQMRALSFSAVAHGADGVMFFQWRASRAGAEKFHGALLPHAGANTRVFREVTQLGLELRSLSAITGARTPARVALLQSWENHWALELPSKPATFDYVRTLSEFHTPLWNQNIALDVISPDGPLARYDVLIAPVLYVISEKQAAALRAFVAGGGTLVLTYFSGVVNEHDQIQLGGYPALLKDVLGLVVEEWQPIPPDATNGLRLAAAAPEAPSVPCRFFSEVVHPQGAEVLATFSGDFLAGRPAITRHRFGLGEAYYFATQPDPAFLETWLRDLLTNRGITAPLQADAGVEACLRRGDCEEFLFIINHQRTSATVTYGAWTGAADLLSPGFTAPFTEELAGFAVRILQRSIR